MRACQPASKKGQAAGGGGHLTPRSNNQAQMGGPRAAQRATELGLRRKAPGFPHIPLPRQVRQGLSLVKNRNGAPRYLLGSSAHLLPGQHSHRVPVPVPQWQPSGGSPHLTTPHPVPWRGESEATAQGQDSGTRAHRSRDPPGAGGEELEDSSGNCLAILNLS